MDKSRLESAASGPRVPAQFRQAFDWKVFEKEEQKMKKKKLARLQNLAAAMNYQLTPLS